jgi:hypothetical protein
MKIPVMFYVWISTFLLLAVTIMVSMNMLFNWVFYMTCLCELLVVFMVYKVLTDNYTTEKTFKDFYEDNPIGNQPFN